MRTGRALHVPADSLQGSQDGAGLRRGPRAHAASKSPSIAGIASPCSRGSASPRSASTSAFASFFSALLVGHRPRQGEALGDPAPVVLALDLDDELLLGHRRLMTRGPDSVTGARRSPGEALATGYPVPESGPQQWRRGNRNPNAMRIREKTKESEKRSAVCFSDLPISCQNPTASGVPRNQEGPGNLAGGALRAAGTDLGQTTHVDGSEVRTASMSTSQSDRSRIHITTRIAGKGATMRQYNYWLDCEYLATWQRFYSRSVREAAAAQQLVRALKTQALLGMQIVIADHQVDDSLVMAHAFSDDDFYRFLSDHPDFMAFLGVSGEDPFSLVTSGARAALEEPDSWRSSIFEDPEIALGLYRAILSDGPQQPSSPLGAQTFKYVQAHPAEAHILKGIARAITYLSSERHVSIDRGAKKTTFDAVLERQLAKAEHQHRDRSEALDSNLRLMHKTLEFVNREAKSHGRDPSKRSLIYTLFDERNWKLSAEEWAMWQTIILAWNRAVQITMGTSQASVGAFPLGAELDLSEGTITVMTALDEARRDEHAQDQMERLDLPDSRLTWEAVSEGRRVLASEQGLLSEVQSVSPDVQRAGLARARDVLVRFWEPTRFERKSVAQVATAVGAGVVVGLATGDPAMAATIAATGAAPPAAGEVWGAFEVWRGRKHCRTVLDRQVTKHAAAPGG